ncbi:hypothetical protein Nepgr_027381 [Nepenthes gracilis]|uniref:Uncharacterized protein n=1 Tax=Nepenthes gracilis TaxID=150966 RepID=A0AAD3TAA8_NEPGR|nr:hypothetical protein Nepgr_027381 [Nepenthes gracilis]
MAREWTFQKTLEPSEVKHVMSSLRIPRKEANKLIDLLTERQKNMIKNASCTSINFYDQSTGREFIMQLIYNEKNITLLGETLWGHEIVQKLGLKAGDDIVLWYKEGHDRLNFNVWRKR